MSLFSQYSNYYNEAADSDDDKEEKKDKKDKTDEDGVDEDSIVEQFLIDDLTHNYGEDAIREFCAPGGIGEALVEAKVLSTKRTMVRLSKQNDLDRRRTIVAINMARAKGDPLYAKLVKFQILRKQAKAAILKKYGNQANRTAIKSQKVYAKAMKNVNLSNAGAKAFITDDPNRKSH